MKLFLEREGVNPGISDDDTEKYHDVPMNSPGVNRNYYRLAFGSHLFFIFSATH